MGTQSARRGPSGGSTGSRDVSAAAELASEQLREGFEQLRVQVREEFKQLRAGIEKLRAEEGRPRARKRKTS